MCKELYNCHDLTLQMSMSVNWRYTHAIPMPAVLIQMAASSAHAWLDMKAMDLTVQVILDIIIQLSSFAC